MEQLHWIETWFEQVREQSHLKVSKIPLSKSKEWSLGKTGWLKHRSGRFFQVAGVRWIDLAGKEFSQPLLAQREIGTLGFIKHNQRILAQAKVEPGNVGVVQLAPTCQATASNLNRVHGGKVPSFAEWFVSEHEKCVHASLQSEQGSRFIGKFNRNILIDADVSTDSAPFHRWIAIDELLELILSDFSVNTDARSVLVCSPWESLVKRQPFTRFSDMLSRELALSFSAADFYSPLSVVLGEIQALRSQVSPAELISLDQLTNWKLSDEGLIPLEGKPFQIFQIKVDVAGREVTGWDQPILSSYGQGYVELVCGRINGLLCFLFIPQIEAGLQNGVELGPASVCEPGENFSGSDYSSKPGAVVLAECLQSDEGGRFFYDVTTYRLVDIGDASATTEKGYWLTLAQIRELLADGGWFTNEARSALSLLLAWL